MKKVFQLFDLWFAYGEHAYTVDSRMTHPSFGQGGKVLSLQSVVLMRYPKTDDSECLYKFPLDIDRKAYPVHCVWPK